MSRVSWLNFANKQHANHMCSACTQHNDCYLQVAVTRKELAELIAAREDFEEQSTKVGVGASRRCEGEHEGRAH